ncbi:venom carboxylesterase-6-like [Onthophagus taurus]|uniref:venom carboxylesterase-6-like n=1 Tax=Onthophagus taurus TaxID=166361 RepID=UPI0039BDDF20
MRFITLTKRFSNHFAKMTSIKFITLLIVFLNLQLGVFTTEEAPKIEISNGLLQGFFSNSYNGRKFIGFEGIPFARPPIGELRFQPPEEPYNWTGTWMANTKHSCIQFLESVAGLEMPSSEDCLYLNVYVPKETISPEDNLDVLIFIHGGGFMLGHPHTLFGPKYLMDTDTITVSINYRLGPLGFLSTQDEIVPGNNGLKDQNLALKWVQKNIKFFGGNPDSVTISGLSAGGASVHFHFLSSLSKGLFHRGYSASGTALDPWVIQEAPLVKAKKLANLLGCNKKDLTSKEILDCFMQRSTQSLFEATQELLVKGMPFSPFGPVIEPDLKGAFLKRNPFTQLADGEVQDLPWLVALATEEGLFPAGFYYHDLEEIDKDWENFAPHIFDYNYTVPEKTKKSDVSKKIRSHYFGDGPITFEKLVKACSDRHFYRGMEKSIKVQRRITNSPIYMFMFAYRGEHSYSELFHVPNTDKGVSHGDESLYYLNTNQFGKLNENDEKVKDVMLKILTSFMKTNKPMLDDFDWKPISKGKLDYFYFNGFENFKMEVGDDLGSNAFWKSLGLKENEDYSRNIKDEL